MQGKSAAIGASSTLSRRRSRHSVGTSAAVTTAYSAASTNSGTALKTTDFVA